MSEFRYFNGFQFLGYKHKKIFDKYIQIDKNIENEAKKLYSKFRNKKVLGVCFRGTDSKKNSYQPHTPTKNQMIYATNKLLKKYKFDKIYLCSEDVNYLKFYKVNLGILYIF